MSTESTLVIARQALHALYLAVDESVAKDVNDKVEAAFSSLLMAIAAHASGDVRAVVSDAMAKWVADQVVRQYGDPLCAFCGQPKSAHKLACDEDGYQAYIEPKGVE